MMVASGTRITKSFRIPSIEDVVPKAVCVHQRFARIIPRQGLASCPAVCDVAVGIGGIGWHVLEQSLRRQKGIPRYLNQTDPTEQLKQRCNNVASSVFLIVSGAASPD